MTALKPSEILSENAIEVLASLDFIRRYEPERHEAGVAPLQFGGSNGSHHGGTATRLAAKGLVDRRYRGYEWGERRRYGARGSCVYRITPAGVSALRTAAEQAGRAGE
jgi:hypothetical protein